MQKVVETSPSTQSELKEALALNPALPHLSWVQALTQTEGRGRQGRTWESPVGNLYFSILLRGDQSSIDSSSITWTPHRVALSIHRALSSLGVSDSNLRIKWPNDLVWSDPTSENHEPKKIAGLICEKIGDHFVVGIGINVDSAPKLDRPTASVKEILLEAGTPESLMKNSKAAVSLLREQLVLNLEHAFSLALKEDYASAYRENQFFKKGQSISWEQNRGTFDRIGDFGEMIVQLDSGVEKALFSDDVHLNASI